MEDMTALTTPVCTGSSTLLSTTDCTFGTPTSYCTFMATATCSDNYYPGFRQVAECVLQPTCYPAPTTTSTCSNGFSASTSLLYTSGSTQIISIDCQCHDGWESITFPSAAPQTSYCLPTASCPNDAIASVSTNSFCLTASIPCQTTQSRCVCQSNRTPQYSDDAFVGCGGSRTNSVLASTMFTGQSFSPSGRVVSATERVLSATSRISLASSSALASNTLGATPQLITTSGATKVMALSWIYLALSFFISFSS